MTEHSFHGIHLLHPAAYPCLLVFPPKALVFPILSRPALSFGQTPIGCRNERELVAHRLPGNQQVISTDRLPASFKISPNCSGDFIVFIRERNRMKRAGKKGLQSLSVEFLTRTLRDAVPELEGGNGRYENLSSLVCNFLKLGANRWRFPIDQRDTSIGIER